MLWSVGLWLMAGSVQAQDSLDVPFRYLGVEQAQVPDRVFLPGEFNGWGTPYIPNTPSCIQDGHPSQMEYQRRERFWQLPVRLRIGSTVEYKVQTQLGNGSTCEWFPDPLNPDITSPDNNSVFTVTDPLLFQLAEEPSAAGNMRAISAGLAGTEAFTDITFAVNGVERTDGLDFFDATTGVFRFELEREVRLGAEIRITATDAQGRVVRATQGEIIPPIDWLTPEFATVRETVEVRASVTRLDGTIDPSLTEATLQVNGVPQTVSVANGQVAADVTLNRGENTLILEATVEGQTFTSAPLTLTGRIHPLDLQLISATVVPQDDGQILVSWSRTELGADATVEASVDEGMSTVPVANISTGDGQVTATATPSNRRGEVYIDLVATTPDELRDPVRVAVIVGPNGKTREMRYEENAEWTKRAIVYEIFPLTFGPISSGSFANPSPRLQQITDELDYIAEMGFTTIWFMPIMYNQFMDPLSGGYNIRDFYRVDPRLGTNDDFKALVARAHELGLRIIMDITPNHASPIHPWVESLRDGGPFAEYIQTQPDPHNQGLDGRGPNLPEIWQVENGENLYRKYDGFGDLANLDWDNDDLQAEFLNILKFWVDEFDIDGWRFDVYWGPWRRYGPDRFGRPIRELMKRIKPDQWLLGENAGTGGGTEVYFADDDNGSAVVGGLDAAYDWNFYFNGILGAYGSGARYDQFARNGDFVPGPNARYFRFLENHDEERIAHRLRANPERILPLSGYLLTTQGVPMVYQGQEVGYGDVPGDNRRTPVTWQTEDNTTFARTYQFLSHARTTFPAFWTQTVRPLNTRNNVYAFARPYQDENAVVAINFASTPRTFTINPTSVMEMSTDGPIAYTDLAADTTHIDAELDGFSVTLAPFETAIFITGDDVDFAVPDLPTLPYSAVYVATEADELPQEAGLGVNYPNPFTQHTTIPYQLDQAGRVQLEVFDLLGRRVAELVDDVQAAGTYTVPFETNALPSGTYLYRLRTEDHTETRTMIVVK
ncbi:MAG: hypothetical protein RhofKO_38700 [Rhodothermales bacterium]